MFCVIYQKTIEPRVSKFGTLTALR